MTQPVDSVTAAGVEVYGETEDDEGHCGGGCGSDEGGDCWHCECCCSCLGCEYGPKDSEPMTEGQRAAAAAFTPST
jgi:hypothetical protein